MSAHFFFIILDSREKPFTRLEAIMSLSPVSLAYFTLLSFILLSAFYGDLPLYVCILF